MRELAKVCGVGPRTVEQRTLRLRAKGVLVADGSRTMRLGVVSVSEKARIDELLAEYERDPSKTFAEARDA